MDASPLHPRPKTQHLKPKPICLVMLLTPDSYTLMYAYPLQRSVVGEGRCRVADPNDAESRATLPARLQIVDVDADLIAAAREDRAAFAPLYRRYVDPVYRYCLRRLGSKEAAEDATALIFEKVLAALPKYRDAAPSFRSWLFSVAHNVLVDTERARRPQHELDDEALGMSDPAPGPEDAALAAERRREVQLLLAAVPPDQRRVLELRLAGLTTAEIAQTLGSSPNAVRVSQFRAMTRLRLVLGLTPHGTGGHDA
jgi:RNA polymerase sigma-70 factor, ECF subfamily